MKDGCQWHFDTKNPYLKVQISLGVRFDSFKYRTYVRLQRIQQGLVVTGFPTGTKLQKQWKNVYFDKRFIAIENKCLWKGTNSQSYL